MSKPKVVILNITHGDNPYMDKSPFLPIAAGACRSDITNDACGEDNISHKNKWYGDFTSLYWAWKNLKDIDIIGTSHYRRYLADKNYLKRIAYEIDWNDFYRNSYSLRSFKKDLKKYDFIMPYPIGFDYNLKEQYISSHPFPENIDVVTDALEEIHPEAVPVWKAYMNGQTMQYGFLFMTTWKNFDGLCSWLYPVLLRCEAKIDVDKYKGYQERVIAFLYERLVPVYLETYKKKIKAYPMYYITSEPNITIKQIRCSYFKQRSRIYQFVRRLFFLLKGKF